MGYYFQITDQSFYIEPKYMGPAHQALLQFAVEREARSVYPRTGIAETRGKSFDALISDFGYSVDTLANGGVSCIFLEHDEFCYDDEALFEVIAPFVKEGSYIQFAGEDGSIWRYSFKNGKYVEQYPNISWEDQK